MFAKTYTRKQAGVIYRACKEGKLSLDKECISVIYDLADEYVSDVTNGQKLSAGIRDAIDRIFANDYKGAQTAIDMIWA